MLDQVIARRTWSKKLRPGHPLAYGRKGASLTLKAEAQLYSLGGVQAPYFSLTGELINNRTRNTNSGGVEMCGQMGEYLVKAWPELAIIEALHLSDEHGVPMHAVENGAYWLGFSKYQKLDLEAFARLWRISTDEAEEAYEYVKAQRTPHTEGMSYNPGASPEEALAVLARAMEPRWADEARRGLELLNNKGE